MTKSNYLPPSSDSTVSKSSLTDTMLTSSAAITPKSPLATLPGLFISHGAPSLASENNATTHALARIGQNLPRPRAIIIMSAHWVAKSLELSNNPKPQTWHDFSGFDDSARQVSYPASGHPALAESLSVQLQKLGIDNNLNPIRPLDHGVWSPLNHLYPDADIPVVQVSLPQYFDAYACYQLGKLFASLRREQILIIGSGNVTHNLAALDWDTDNIDKHATDFKKWLLKQLKNDVHTALDWQQHPKGEQVHPTAEHILPLFFALGTGERVSVIHERMAHYSLGMDIYRFD